MSFVGRLAYTRGMAGREEARGRASRGKERCKNRRRFMGERFKMNDLARQKRAPQPVSWWYKIRKLAHTSPSRFRAPACFQPAAGAVSRPRTAGNPSPSAGSRGSPHAGPRPASRSGRGFLETEGVVEAQNAGVQVGRDAHLLPKQALELAQAQTDVAGPLGQ